VGLLLTSRKPNVPIIQQNRFLAIETALGPDALGLRSAAITEQLGRMFQIEAELSSEDGQIDLDQVVGHPATIRLNVGKNKKRFFHGIVSRMVQVGNSGGFAHYRATVVPWLWLLTRTADCRIFQKQTVPTIIEEIFKDHGFSDYELKLSGDYQQKEYCVQYRESDFNFVSRLMEQEGIYYYFAHEQGKDTLVIADSASAHTPFEGYADVTFHELERGATGREVITDWTVEKEVQPVAYALQDFNFEKPKVNLLSPSSVSRPHGAAEFEIFDYPGEYEDLGSGERLAKIRIEELQTLYETVRGRSSARGLATGSSFKLKGHPREDQNREYLITAVSIHVDGGEFAVAGKPNGEEFFNCSVSAVDLKHPFRTERTTPKPIVQGPQTAIVVGPSGEEIHTDAHARVKVHFHWDRHGEPNENASCFIRVSQPWAGKGWGSMATPRIGQEVIVEFLEGDPDRPIITGRVYNGETKPPYAAGNGVVSGMKSNTHKGTGFNEMSLDDTAGKEKITIHAQYDMNTTVQHDQSDTVKSGKRTVTVETGTNTETIKGNSIHTVQAGFRKVEVTGGDYSAESTDAAANITGKTSVNIKGQSAGVDVHGKGGPGVKIEGDGATGVKLVGAPNFDAFGKSKAIISSPDVDIGDKKIVIHGSTSIELVVGGNSIKIDGSGVAINGTKIAISGASINSSASGIHEIAGAMVKIN
jgi:type VI secretion system secreted protein VgrG